MKLVVGLGNPGRKYEGTRHNIGWEVLAKLAADYGSSQPRAKFQGEVVEARLGGSPALLLAPHTYMNLSGRSVAEARSFYKIDDEDVLVVCDDFNLPLAKMRFRRQGSAGGQKGLADIIRALGSDEIGRLRIGVGEVPAQWNPADFVLSKFTKDERPEIDDVVAQASQAIDVWARQGIGDAMNQFN